MKIAIVFLSVLSLSAFAGPGDNKQGNNKPISLDKLVELCERLDANPQLKKFSSQISCEGYKTDWVETTTSKAVDLENEFVVVSNITMKGNRYNVKEETAAFQLPSSKMACKMMKELRYDLRPLTITLTSCEDLKKIQEEGRAAYCARVLEDAPVVNNSGVETGAVKTSCN